MNRLALGGGAAALGALVVAGAWWWPYRAERVPVPEVRWADVPGPVSTPVGHHWVPVKLRSGSTLGTALMPWGLPFDTIRAAALDHYDLVKIRPDRDLHVGFRGGEVDAVAVRYRITEDKDLIVERVDGAWTARLDEVAYEVESTVVAFALTRSLWLDGLDAGLRPVDLVRLAQIFEYELDFNSELRAGDQFIISADRLVGQSGDRDLTKLGAIHAVRLVSGASSRTAVRWQPATGKEGYWRPDGTAMKRPFLRSPLEFSRVTSGYNPRRFHPILKTARPHNGTDFGAPTGTPIRAVGDATVELAGRSGGHGNFVKLNHGNGVQTSYSHLNKIRVQRGQRVKQGDHIGDVGTTGMSTGPHLHYQMWKNGKYVDAMKTDLPTAPPLPVNDRAAFLAEASKRVAELDRGPPLPVGP